MIDKPELGRTLKQTAAVIHLTIPREQIRHAMGPAIQEVLAEVAAQNMTPTGPLFSHHFKMDPGIFDLEVGVPVAKPVEPNGRVTSTELPEVNVIRTIFHGGYEGLGTAWGEFGAAIARLGRNTGPDVFERYLKGPESDPDPAQWQTELSRPLSD